MTAVYLAIGAAEMGVRNWRALAATGPSLALALSMLGCMCCQRYVAEVDDGRP